MTDFHYTKVQDISPIPIVKLYLQNPSNDLLSTTFDCAILDTGSDATIVSWDIVSKLQLRAIGSQKSIPFRGLGTEAQGVPFRIQLSFDGIEPIKSKVMAVPAALLNGEIIIGRNILNRYLITFNGPKLVFTIDTSP